MSRTRSRSSSNNGDFSYQRLFADGQVKSPTITGQEVVSSIFEECIDHEVPGWRSKIGDGWVINNPALITKTIHKSNICSWSNFLGPTYVGSEAQPKTGFHTVGTLGALRILEGQVYRSSLIHESERDYQRSLLIDQATTAAADPRQQEAMILVMAGELRQTYSTFTSFAKNVLNLIRSIVSVQSKRIGIPQTPKYRKVLLDLSNLELQYRYGLAASIRDAQKAVKGLSKQWKKRQNIRFRTNASRRWYEIDADTFSNLDGFNGSIRLSGDNNISSSIAIKAYALWELRRDSKFLADLDAIGTTSIFESLWELTRLSFVIDWFLDIGSKLAAFAPNLRSKLLTSGYVRREQVVYSISGQAQAEPGYSAEFDLRNHSTNCSPAEKSLTELTYERNVDHKVSIIPVLRIPTDPKQLATLTQIFAQIAIQKSLVRAADYLLPLLRTPNTNLRRYR